MPGCPGAWLGQELLGLLQTHHRRELSFLRVPAAPRARLLLRVAAGQGKPAELGRPQKRPGQPLGRQRDGERPRFHSDIYL